MHKRTAHRWRLTALMMAGIFFALGSFWLLQVMNRGDDELRAEALKNEPDYIVEKFSVVRMTPEGQPKYIISGEKLTHRPIDDSSEVERPLVQNMAPGTPPMTIKSLRARIDQGANKVDLRGAVDINRAAPPGGKPMTLKTEALTIFPDEDRMLTDQPVAMTLGSSSVRGTGMRADNAAQTVHVAGRGQLIYPPRNAQ